jgi:pseudouridine synthase
MRINKYVAAGSGLSRRAADQAISSGRVKIAEHVASLGQSVTGSERITLDGLVIGQPPASTYIMLNKPPGYVSSRAHQGTHPNLYELLPIHLRDLRIAGRLDQDSSGLTLLSNDGDFIQAVTHPSRGKSKEYELRLSAPLSEDHKRSLKKGVILSDGPSHVILLAANGPSLTISIEEGRNRQLRRTFGALGLAVLRLHRTRVGPYILTADLAPGMWRTFEPELASK